MEPAAGAGAQQRIYHLHYGEGSSRLSLLSIDDHVLLVLDRELDVLVGDASWSYVLNRKPTQR